MAPTGPPSSVIVHVGGGPLWGVTGKEAGKVMS
jgi:hypothetical protein